MKRYLCPLWMLLFVGCGLNPNPNVFNEVFPCSNDQSVPQHAMMKSQPVRGNIYDRNGICLVENKPNYILWTIPNNQDAVGIDTVQLARIIGISSEQLAIRLRDAAISPAAPTIVDRFITKKAKKQLEDAQLKGFYCTAAPVRFYPEPIAAHVLGYVSQMSPQYAIERQIAYDENRAVGVTGLEKMYNDVLAGSAQPITAGQNLTCTLDARLQRLGEALMNGKTGAAVAIEPSTGEILMMVSAPAYDPALLVGRKRGDHYMDLLQNEGTPVR